MKKNKAKEICHYCGGTGCIYGQLYDPPDECDRCCGTGDINKGEFPRTKEEALQEQVYILKQELNLARRKIQKLEKKVSDAGWEQENRRQEIERRRAGEWR